MSSDKIMKSTGVDGRAWYLDIAKIGMKYETALRNQDQDAQSDAVQDLMDTVADHTAASVNAALERVEANIEDARVDGMFIEWNGLNLCDIDHVKAAIQAKKINVADSPPLKKEEGKDA